MDTALTILVIEDSPADFLLIERHLRKAGLAARCRRVSATDALVAALNDAHWDVVLSDYNVPGITFAATLALVRGRRPDLPLILISGGLGEEEAAEWLKQGAWDFVLKGSLARLVPAIERSLKEAEEHRAIRAAEQALRDSNFRFSQLVSGLPQLVWTCDANGCCGYLNDRWLAYTGIAESAQLGLGWLDCVHSDDRDRIRTAWQVALSTCSDYAVEFRLRRHDGHYRWFDTRAVPLRAADGSIEKWFGSSSDIQEAREAREALRLSEARMSAIFRISPAAISVSRLSDGLFFDANEAFLTTFGFSREDLLGHTAGELGLWPEAGEREALAQELRQSKRLRNREIRFRLKSGAYGDFLYSAALTPLNGEDCVLSVMLDVTDFKHMKQSEEDLRQSNSELEQFAYVASHDLREPLRMITSYLGLLERRLGATLDADSREFMHFAKDGAIRMDALILDLLEYSRVGRDAVHAPVALDAVLEEARLNLAAAIADAAAEVGIDAGLPTISGDRHELVRLFQNLIANAIKYHHPDRRPVIQIGHRDDGERWVVFVNDNGTGIEARDFERVFGIFQRLVSRDQCEGTGIGLAICHKIVEQHGGRIWIESVMGEGSRFLISFPKLSSGHPG